MASSERVGHVETVVELLQTKIDVNHVNHVNRLGWTALLEAVILGDGESVYAKIVTLLVDHGAKINLPDGNGVSPLVHAQDRGYRKIAEILETAIRP